MSLELAIHAKLAATAAVTNLVSTRIYLVNLPQSPSYPAVTIARVSGVREHNLSGPSGLARPRISISGWGTYYNAAKNVAEAIRQTLDGFSGTVSGVDIQSVHLENEIDLYEDEPEVFRTMTDYFIQHQES